MYLISTRGFDNLHQIFLQINKSDICYLISDI